MHVRGGQSEVPYLLLVMQCHAQKLYAQSAIDHQMSSSGRGRCSIYSCFAD